MKRISLILILLSITILSCSLQMSSTTTEYTTMTTTLEEETTITQRPSLETLYNELLSMIPLEIAQDFFLPNLDEDDLFITYYQDDLIITDQTLKYEPSMEGIDTTLTVIMTRDGDFIRRNIEIHMTENPEDYHLIMIEQAFSDIGFLLDQAIPTTIVHNFKIPEIEYEGATIRLDFGEENILNGHFIFPFPEYDRFFSYQVFITYRGIHYNEQRTILIKGLDALPKIPEMHIDTSDIEVWDKESYVNGHVTMVTYNQDQEEIPIIMDEPMKIRARGNSTLYMPKLSYKIKFDEKQSLVFDYKEKDWVLLANFADQTLIRTYLANQLSNGLAMAFTPSSQFVDVYLNDEYIGNYMLTDQIEVTRDRVAIEEHSAELNTGYLLEMDKRLLDIPSDDVLGFDYFILYGYPYHIKSPQTDEPTYSVNQLYYIEDYLVTVHQTLRNIQDYRHLIDEASFIDWFIVQEVFQNVDSGYSSVYMYKQKDGLLYMGPVWDFDLSAGNPGHLGDDLRKPEGWYTSLEYKNIWYHYLMQNEIFRQRLKLRWNEIYETQILTMIDSIYSVAGSIALSRYSNFLLWDIIGTWEDWYTAPEVLAADSYELQLAFLHEFLSERATWLNEQINQF